MIRHETKTAQTLNTLGNKVETRDRWNTSGQGRQSDKTEKQTIKIKQETESYTTITVIVKNNLLKNNWHLALRVLKPN